MIDVEQVHVAGLHVARRIFYLSKGTMVSFSGNAGRRRHRLYVRVIAQLLLERLNLLLNRIISPEVDHEHLVFLEA